MTGRINGARGPRTVWRAGEPLAPQKSAGPTRKCEPKITDPARLELEGEEQVLCAESDRDAGHLADEAFALSRASRNFLELGEFHGRLLKELLKRGAGETALETQRQLTDRWYRRSIELRRQAIAAFDRLGFREVATDSAFLGKTLFDLGILLGDPDILREAVKAREQAHAHYKSQRRQALAVLDLSYLAATHREIARLEESGPLKVEHYLLAQKFSRQVLEQFPAFLSGEELVNRSAHEKWCLLLVEAKIAFINGDLEAAAGVRERILVLAGELKTLGFSGKAGRALYLAAKAQRFIAGKSGERPDLEEALRLTERAHKVFLELGDKEVIERLEAHIQELKQALNPAVSEVCP